MKNFSEVMQKVKQTGRLKPLVQPDERTYRGSFLGFKGGRDFIVPNSLPLMGVILFMWQTPAYALSWTQATAAAQWTVRGAHTSVVHLNNMWVIGGAIVNDVWSSTNGVTWTQATAAAGWAARYEHTSVVTSDGRMWVIGGTGFSGAYRDVWYSTDGVTWTCATANAAWTARYNHTSVVTGGTKLWVIGGNDGVSKNDVWYSTDGITWTLATAAAAWAARYGHTSVVTSDGRMWVIGGYDGASKNDVWYSTDGITWTRATAAAAWSARAYHTSVVTLATAPNKMWVIGGSGTNDVWSSTNGVNWVSEGTAQWSGRDEHTSVVFNNRLWVIGGLSGPYVNDVWYSNVPTAVELVDFSAIGRNGVIELSWRTKAEIDNMKWLIVRNQGQETFPTEDWEQIACLQAEGSLSDYKYIDSLVVPGVYWYKLGDVDNSGNITWNGPVSAICIPINNIGIRLAQPIPSPFNKEVRIEYQVMGRKSKGAVDISLKIYDGSGQLIKLLIDESQNPGRRVVLWDGKDNHGEIAPSGIYFCSLSTGESKLTRKLIHIK